MATHELYDQGFYDLIGTNNIDWENDTIAAVLLSDSYNKDLSDHTTYSDVSDDEASDSDYSPVEVPNTSTSLSDGDVTFTSDDVVFGEDVSISGRYIVFIKGDPSDLSSDDPLISVHDLEETKSSTNSEFRLNKPSEGHWFNVSRS